MARIADAWLEHQRRRWTRLNADRWRQRHADSSSQIARVWHGRSFYDALYEQKSSAAAAPTSRRDDERIVAAIRRAQSHIAAARVELALKRLAELCRKAGFNPNQPRVPAGNSDGGQWTSGGGGGATGGANGPATNDSRVLSDAAPDDEWKPGAQYASNRPIRGQFPNATPGQNARLAAAELREFSAIQQIRQIAPSWQPRTVSAAAPGSIEGHIAHTEARAIEAETHLRELARQPHEQLLELYRQRNAPRDLFGQQPWPRQQHTVAVCTPGGQTLLFGTNSRAPTYPPTNYTTAQRTVDSMIEQFPETMNQRDIGGWPNPSLYHAESTILLNMRKTFGGTLAGRSFNVTVDNPMCSACEIVLPRLGVHLGNPRVNWFDELGLKGTMHNGRWLTLRPR